MKRETGTGRTLAKKRKSLSYTQHQLSADSGVSLSRIIYGETDRLDLEPNEIEAIKTALRRRAQKAMDAIT